VTFLKSALFFLLEGMSVS